MSGSQAPACCSSNVCSTACLQTVHNIAYVYAYGGILGYYTGGLNGGHCSTAANKQPASAALQSLCIATRQCIAERYIPLAL